MPAARTTPTPAEQRAVEAEVRELLAGTAEIAGLTVEQSFVVRRFAGAVSVRQDIAGECVQAWLGLRSRHAAHDFLGGLVEAGYLTSTPLLIDVTPHYVITRRALLAVQHAP